MSNEFIALEEWKIAEIIKCYHDPVYFIKNYVWIERKETGQLIQFKMFPYQEKILNSLVNGNSLLILKSRRVGASTVIAAYVAWLINFRRGINALLISREEKMAKKLLEKVKFNLVNVKMHDNEDYLLATDASWLLNDFSSTQENIKVSWTDDQGSIASVSEVWSLTTTSESGRGDSATFVFADELAFLPDQDKLMRSALLTTLRGGHWCACSTPNGVGDKFHEMCMRAERGENKSYDYIRVHWTEADITEEEIEGVMEIGSQADRMQEMELEFLSSGDPVFNHLHLSACYRPPEDYPEVEAELRRYHDLVMKSKGDVYYYSGVDTAVGKLTKKDSKRDYHCFTTLTKSAIQAFTYSSKEDSLSAWAGNIENAPGNKVIYYEGIVSKFHSKYPGFLQIEINGPGVMVFNNHKLPDDGYSTIAPKNTTVKTKSQLILQLIQAVEEHSIIITDKFTYQCMTVYQRGTTAGSFSAPIGDYYDDPVMALAIAYDGLLQHGALEFTWGATADVLTRDSYGGKETEMSLSGPVLYKEAGKDERLSNYYDGGSSGFIDPTSDIDLSKLKQPEFMENENSF